MVLDLDTRPEHERWLSAAATVLARTDRILSGRDEVTVGIQQLGPAPAWSDGSRILLRGDDWARTWGRSGYLPTLADVRRLMGLNYHELCHCMFTPREHTFVGREVRRLGLFPVFNLADDQRIETLFTALYRPAIPFFAQAVLDLIVNQDEAEPHLAWALLAGRRYLPKTVRAAARAAYTLDADEWEALISEYLLLDWDLDPNRGIELLQLMNRHLAQAHTELPGCGTPMPARGQVSEDEEADAQERVAERMEEEAEEEAEAETPTLPEPTEAEQEQAEEDATEDTEAEDTEPGPSTGGTEPSQEDLEDALESAMSEALAEAEQATETQAANADQLIESELEQPEGEIGENLDRYEERTMVTDEAKAQAHDLEAVLAELRMLADPGWLSHRDVGKIHAGRYLRRESWEPLDQVFDEWNPGAEDALDIEIALIYDTSLSMNDGADQGVAEAGWAIKRALYAQGIPCAVLSFNSMTNLVYGADEDPDPEYMPAPLARGGTSPQAALIEVGGHFAHSQHRRRILVMLTDGDVPKFGYLRGEAVLVEDIVASIDAELTVLLRFGPEAHLQTEALGFDEVMNVTSTDALAEVVRETIVDGVRRTGIEERTW